MLTHARHLLAKERGFTLIELLVVILIIGILVAIALPAFLGQDVKGQDAVGKSNARYLVTQVESCNADTRDYTECDSPAELGNTSLNVDPPGSLPTAGNRVAVTDSAASNYVVIGLSRSGNYFAIVKDSSGLVSRTCGTTMTTAGAGSGADRGGCKGNTW